MVACGGVHTMAVTAAGHAWTCGFNCFGQLGVGDTADRLGFTQVDAGQLGGARIVMGACGLAQSVLVSAEGRVWTFGLGSVGCSVAGASLPLGSRDSGRRPLHMGPR